MANLPECVRKKSQSLTWPLKMDGWKMLEDYFGEGNFSRAMLNFGGVVTLYIMASFVISSILRSFLVEHGAFR